jgi:hypothetical protein
MTHSDIVYTNKYDIWDCPENGGLTTLDGC